MARLRITVLRGKRGWRMAEPCLLMAAFVTLGMLLPLAFPCTPTQCYIEQGQTQPVCPPGVSPNVQCAPPLRRARQLASGSQKAAASLCAPVPPRLGWGVCNATSRGGAP